MATRTTESAPKKSKHEKKPIGELKEPSSKSKSKAIKAAQADIPSPPIPSKGKKRKEEADVSDEEEPGESKKAKRAKTSVDHVPNKATKAGKERKRERESKGEKTEEEVVLKRKKEEQPTAKTKKGKKVADESEVEAVVKSTLKTRKLSRETVQSSPEPEAPFDFGHITDDDDDDSSDEEDDIVDIPELGVLKLHTVLKDDATVKRKLEKAKRQPAGDFGVIYLSHLPHGFYEDQLRGYFSQFGTVTRLRLSRSKKSGRSKHYAFLEFDSSSVAKIVAETMDNYLLMGHILRCDVIPKDKVHPELWVGANKKWKMVPRDRIERLKHDKPRTQEEIDKATNRLIKRQTEKKRKLEESDIKYDFEAVAYKKV
ncbi:hypothetical protein PILCRDRAFT_818411 [Piloderma croceum F 1598]|uniref:RRM domain-containing protein n=1 Tax=Piloderma croceum (strain F 1598) TaxID=765440 RepID=A0A0C3FX45_PILCF|nr:hypothetical protein PILCRDRAFT_818411 [Piloderma croceum F 1598]